MKGLHAGWEGGDAGILSDAGMRSEVELWEQQAEREFGAGSTGGVLCVLPRKRSCSEPLF